MSGIVSRNGSTIPGVALFFGDRLELVTIGYQMAA